MLVDTHAHLVAEQFDADRDTVIERAEAAGVRQIICIGTTLDSSRRSIELASRHEGVFASVGIHPNHVAEADPNDWSLILDLAKKAVAIGETGLDRYWKDTPFDQQIDWFDRHLRLMHETGLPVVIHMRDCLDDMLAALHEASRRAPLVGVMHSYTGDLAAAEECIAMGLHISFAGMITYKKSTELRDVASKLPADKILVETDSPYLAPEPLRGKRNEPANVVHTARIIAAARGIPFEEFARQTSENARRLFRLSPGKGLSR
jgi:TatD DNase family protein